MATKARLTKALLDPDETCEVQREPGEYCQNPATVVMEEPYTPAGFRFPCCETCAKELEYSGYRRVND